MGKKVRYRGGDDLLRIPGPKTRLHHRSRINVELDRGLASTQNIPLEVRRHVDHEGVSSAVHQGTDLPLGAQLRRLEEWRQQPMRAAAPEYAVVLEADST